MEGVVDIDGRLTPSDEARISVFDRGFLYGDSAFEVMRTYGRRPFRQDDHLRRLERSCERLRIRMPLSREALAGRVHRAVEHSGLPECYVRIVVTRGVGPMGLDLTLAHDPSVLIYALPLSTPPDSAYERGIAAGLVHAARATDGTAAVGAKTSNYLGSVLALEEVRARGCQEAIIVGPQGEVVEGATSNVFVVEAGGLSTPPSTAGILEGITRRTVFELADQLGLPCRERQLSPTDLYRADEVFITSSVREMLPVVRIDELSVGEGRPGPVFGRILAAYRARAVAG